jgi:hypothetical protein
MSAENRVTLFKNQLLWEIDSLFRTLVYLKQENIFLKNRLSEVIKDINIDDMQKIEEFQSRFLNKDTIMSIIQHDISLQKKLLTTASNEKGITDTILKKQKKLRDETELLEKKLIVLRTSFNTYLADTYEIIS